MNYVDDLMQEKCNSIANTLEQQFSCTNPSMYSPCNAAKYSIQQPATKYVALHDILRISYSNTPTTTIKENIIWKASGIYNMNTLDHNGHVYQLCTIELVSFNST